MNQDVKAYFAAVPEKRKGHVEVLHKAIIDCFPKAMVDLKYNMPTYTYGSGWVAIANQKHYVSLYTCSAAHLESFRSTYPNYKTGKGCINFREKDEIPVEAVKEVIKHAIEHPKGR